MSLMGQAIGIKNHELLTVTTGGMLMDVGKLNVSQDLLNMPDQIDKAQMTELKKHVLPSHNLLKDTVNVSEGVKVIAEQHHEKLDGSGYPFGLKGKDLNELARMSCIADIFCALTDERPYKPAYDCETALGVLEKMEDQLDPFLLKLFKEIVKLVYNEIEEPVVH
jgi:HD-GYP domain-containing protein (c-di-GMP phosphodiesterase class II)